MVENFRNFETGLDPFGRSWQVSFRWQQNAISIRHADTVDTKWDLTCDGEVMEKVVALPLPALLSISSAQNRTITDGWCMKLGGMHLIEMISSWQDMDKNLVTATAGEIEHYATALAQAEREAA
ncbi:MAG: hypothetical protein ACK5TN_09575 [Acidobacteriota bacterium]|jgi:hypothetical protein